MKRFGLKSSFFSLGTLILLLLLAVPAFAGLGTGPFTGTVTQGNTNSHQAWLTTGQRVYAVLACDGAVGSRTLNPQLFVSTALAPYFASAGNNSEPKCNTSNSACVVFTAATTGVYTFEVSDAYSGTGGAYTLILAINTAQECVLSPDFTGYESVSIITDDPFSYYFGASGNPTPDITYTNINLPPGVTLDPLNDTLSGSPTAAGVYSIEATADNDVGVNAVMTLMIYVTDPATITSPPSANAGLGSPFSFTFTASGDPAPMISYSNENLPPGVTLDGDTLSGTPTQMGTYTITLTASNKSKDYGCQGFDKLNTRFDFGAQSPNDCWDDAVQTFTIVVGEFIGTAPAFSSPSTATVTNGAAFSHSFTVSGDPAPVITYSDENLPPGVTRSGNTLSGIPTVPGTYTITATASNGEGEDAVQILTITVSGDEVAFTNASETTGTVGTPFSFNFTATGNPTPTLTYSAENLPPGVTLTGNMLSGTPTVPGVYTITVTASNGQGEDAIMTLTITVDEMAIAPTPIPVPYAEDVNFDEDSIARTDVSTPLQDDINVRELYINGSPIQQPNGNYYDAGIIGNQGVVDLGIIQAIDIFSANGLTYFEGGATFCLRGEGTLIWMAAKNSPRIAEIIGSYLVDDYPGHTCATLFEQGTLVLVETITP